MLTLFLVFEGVNENLNFFIAEGNPLCPSWRLCLDSCSMSYLAGAPLEAHTIEFLSPTLVILLWTRPRVFLQFQMKILPFAYSLALFFRFFSVKIVCFRMKLSTKIHLHAIIILVKKRGK